MVRVVLLVVFTQLVLCNTQMYDMSDGNDEGLECPCNNGAIGRCTEEDANLYPGGPTSGSVYSTDTSSSCIDVPDPITVTENSKFNMKVHVPYTQSWDYMQVVLIKEGTAGWLEWFRIIGPIPENERWMEVSMPLPETIKADTYKVSIWDNASSNKISIRYFEITEEDLVTTTASTTDFSTASTTASTASTTDFSTASTTDFSTASTTDFSTASTTDFSTASTTDFSTASTTDFSTASTTASTIESTIDSTTESPIVSITESPTEPKTEPTTTTQKTSDATNVPQDQTTIDPPPRGSKISVWGVILGIVIGITAMSLLICCALFIAAGWRRRRRENKPDDMVALPRLEVVHTSDSSTNSSIIGITGKRTQNWLFR